MLCCAVGKDQCKLTNLSVGGCALTDKCLPSLCAALSDVRCRLTTLDLKSISFEHQDDVTEEGKRLLLDVEKSQHCKDRGLKIIFDPWA